MLKSRKRTHCIRNPESNISLGWTVVDGGKNQGDCTIIEILRLAGLQKKSPQLRGGSGAPWKAVCFLVASDWFSTKCALVNSPKSIKNEGRISGSTHMNCFYLDSLCFVQSGRQCFRALPQSLAGAETQSLFGMKRYWKAGCSNWSLHLQTPAWKAAGLWGLCVCECVCVCLSVCVHLISSMNTGTLHGSFSLNCLEGIQAAQPLSLL